MTLEKSYNIKEVSEILGVSVGEVRKLVEARQITFFEVGLETSKRKRKCFREKDIKEYIKKHKISAIDDNE